MTADVRILLISGSTRSGSGNTAALRTVPALAPPGVTALMYDGLAAIRAALAASLTELVKHVRDNRDHVSDEA